MLVSVVIPCYNAEKTISHCIDSVLKQDYTEIEIIIVDDGSTDHTLNLITAYQNENKAKIKILKQINRGACAARNAGVKVSSGEYLQFLDADDLLISTKISHQVSLVLQNNYPDFIAASYFRKNESIVEVNVTSNDAWVGLITGRLGCTCSNFFKKKAIELVGGWNEFQKSSQESELMFRLLQSNASVVIDNASLTEVYVSKSNSISSNTPLENLFRYFKLRTEISSFLTTKKILTKERKHVLAVNLLSTLRIIYRSDKKEALRLYKCKFQHAFYPCGGPGVSKLYVGFVRLFGFNFAEIFYSIFRR